MSQMVMIWLILSNIFLLSGNRTKCRYFDDHPEKNKMHMVKMNKTESTSTMMRFDKKRSADSEQLDVRYANILRKLTCRQML